MSKGPAQDLGSVGSTHLSCPWVNHLAAPKPGESLLQEARQQQDSAGQSLKTTRGDNQDQAAEAGRSRTD